MGSMLAYDGIVIDRCQCRIQRRSVLSGPNYLYTQVTIHCRGVYNPAFTAYTTGTGKPATSGSRARPADPGPGKTNPFAAALNRIPLNAAGGGAQVINPRIPAAVVNQGFGGDVAALAQEIASQSSNVERTTAIIRSPVRAPQTDVAIRHALMQPRKRLIFLVGTDIVYNVPGPDPKYTVDVSNGPQPVSCDVVEINGLKTFMVEFTVSFAVNERDRADFSKLTTAERAAIGSGRSPYNISPLLLNEYSMEHSVDQDFFTTRTITGRAVFRADVLAKERLVPDQLRLWVGHPVPQGFNRQSIRVKALPDGLTLEYTVVDRERALPVNPNIVTRIEAVYTKEIAQQGFEQLLGWGYQGVSRSSRFIGPGPTALASAGLMAAVVATPAGILGGSIVNVMNREGGSPMGALAGIPVTHHHLTVRAWGHSTAMMSRVEREVRGFINDFVQENRINFNRFVELPNGRQFHFGAENTRITTDLAGKFIEIHRDWIGSLLLTFAALIARAPNPEPGLEVNTASNLRVDPMRGCYLGSALAQSLRDTDTPHVQPQDPPNVDERDFLRTRNRFGRGQIDGVRVP